MVCLIRLWRCFLLVRFCEPCEVSVCNCSNRFCPWQDELLWRNEMASRERKEKVRFRVLLCWLLGSLPRHPAASVLFLLMLLLSWTEFRPR
jgi:hypothetical protein